MSALIQRLIIGTVIVIVGFAILMSAYVRPPEAEATCEPLEW